MVDLVIFPFFDQRGELPDMLPHVVTLFDPGEIDLFSIGFDLIIIIRIKFDRFGMFLFHLQLHGEIEPGTDRVLIGK